MFTEIYLCHMTFFYQIRLSIHVSGLKVTGGKPTEYGYLGAFITKVKKGSIADTVGNLRAGN